MTTQVSHCNNGRGPWPTLIFQFARKRGSKREINQPRNQPTPTHIQRLSEQANDRSSKLVNVSSQSNMPATTSPVATTNSSSSSSSPAQMPLSVHRPALFSRKRKLSAVEATSPTSLDEVSNSRSSSSNNNGSTPHEGRVISPKKKAKAEERASEGNLSKWESQVVVSIAGALDLDCLNGPEPISFCAAPAGDLTADELVILCRFLA